jgi:hypothetical protein
MRWKRVAVGGGGALPCTAFSDWQPGSEVPLGDVVFGGLLTGHPPARSNGETRYVGIQAGIDGGLRILWAVFDTYVPAAGFTGPV